MTKSARGEKHAIFFIAFGMAIVSFVVLSIMQERFRLLIPVQHRHHILDSHPVPRFIKINRVNGIGALHKTVDNQQFRHDVICPAGMPAEPFDIGKGSKENQAVTHYPNIVEQDLTLLICQASLLQIILLGYIFT